MLFAAAGGPPGRPSRAILSILRAVRCQRIALLGPSTGAAQPTPEVTIRRGPAPESLPNARSWGTTWQIAGKQFPLSIPEMARRLLIAERETMVAPEAEAGAGDVSIFVLGTVLGIVLLQHEGWCYTPLWRR